MRMTAACPLASIEHFPALLIEIQPFGVATLAAVPHAET
jgi:hypothetical protein